MDKKIINVKYSEKVVIDICGADKVKERDYSARIEVNTKKHRLHDIMEQLIAAGNVLDITVSDQPLEDIIAGIYRSPEVALK